MAEESLAVVAGGIELEQHGRELHAADEVVDRLARAGRLASIRQRGDGWHLSCSLKK